MIYCKWLQLFLSPSQYMARSCSVCRPSIRSLSITMLFLLLASFRFAIIRNTRSAELTTKAVRLSSRPKPCHSLSFRIYTACPRTFILPVVMNERHIKKAREKPGLNFNFLLNIKNIVSEKSYSRS